MRGKCRSDTSEAALLRNLVIEFEGLQSTMDLLLAQIALAESQLLPQIWCSIEPGM
jgi:hypothetical protein